MMPIHKTEEFLTQRVHICYQQASVLSVDCQDLYFLLQVPSTCADQLPATGASL